MADHPYHGPWPKVRRLVLERDHHQCQINGPRCTTTATDVDHIISWQNGGAWYDQANLRAACARCNRGRTKYVAVTTSYPGPSRTW